MRALYTLTLFLSSGLLFLVQPMVAKMILPRFGGSPAVWTASMLFFQVLLLLGYAYAHASVKWLGARRQAIVHIGLLAVAAAFCRLTLSPDAGLEISAFEVLKTLGVMVGLPFLALSAGAPLIQRWFGSTSDPAAKDPYFLYSASNLGSMIALLAYPFLLEPRLALGEQGRVWTFGLYGLVALMLVCALLLQRQPAAVEERVENVAPVEWRQRLQWVLLTAVPSSLLLGVTNYLTTNVAPMPLLWIVPLTIYLVTFIVAFARKQWVASTVWARVLPLVVTPLVLVMVLEATEPMGVLAGMHLLAFTVAALMCHTRLAETRPATGNLTEFYVWLSVGGAVGGLFNALVAPTVFSILAEYPIAIVAASMLRPIREGVKTSLAKDVVFGTAMLVLTIGIAYIAQQAGMEPSRIRTAAVIGLPVILCFLMSDYPVRFGLMAGAIFMGSHLMGTSSAGTIAYRGRSFFGVHRVVHLGGGRYHQLVHGNTVHGIQDMEEPGEPRTYYARNGPIGEVFSKFPNVRNVGMVGLGVGSCAAYGKPGMNMTYFEIDPVVEKVARDPEQFTFLRDSKADVQVVMGDARLTLGQSTGGYDLIILDAFSSDSIPIHLLTKQALEMYLSKLTGEGVLAFHISNRYLNLEPILAEIAKSLDLQAYAMTDGATDEEERVGKRPSTWMAFARKGTDLSPLVKRSSWLEAETRPGTPLWTDDYSNILSAFEPD